MIITENAPSTNSAQKYAFGGKYTLSLMLFESLYKTNFIFMFFLMFILKNLRITEILQLQDTNGLFFLQIDLVVNRWPDAPVSPIYMGNLAHTTFSMFI